MPRLQAPSYKLQATFRFTGGKIVGEFLLSIGYLSGAHVLTCPVYQLIIERRPPWFNEKG